jgi:hypothetical protein
VEDPLLFDDMRASNQSLHYGFSTTNTHLWLATFFDVICDCLPGGTIHLPISLTWHEVYYIG